MSYEIDRRTVLRAGGLATGLLVSGLVGCSADSSPTSSPSPSGSPAQGKQGGTLRFAVSAGQTTDTADPAKSLGTYPLLIAANCYDTLTWADPDYNLSPSLATEWTPSENGQVWKFRLRDGVTFHDGSPLTSKDVVYTFKRILDPKLGASTLATVSPYLEPDGIVATDPTTVTFNLVKPNGFFPVIVSAVGMSIVKDGTTDFAKGNGTGPFSITSFQPGSRLSLERTDTYWQDGLPYLDGVEVVTLAEDASRLQALKAGNQDMVDNITGASTLLLTGDVDSHVVKAGGWVGLTMFGDTAPFNDQRIIQAMQYAADRQKILSVVAPGIDMVTPDIPIPPTDPFYPTGLEPRPYDPDRSLALLKEAGLDSLDIDVYAYQGDKLDTVVAYKSTAEPGGINVNVKNVPHETFFSDIFMKRPAIGISVARLHISQALPRLYSKSGDLNLTRFQNDQLDELVAAAVSTTDESEQRQHFADALTLINDSAANVIPGWEGQVYGKSKQVTGIEATNGAQVYLRRVSFA